MTLKTEVGAIPPGQYFARRWALYAALGVPQINLTDWRLRMTGLVENSLEYTYEQLTNRPQATYTKDFHCVTTWSIKDVRWEGVRIKDLAEEAKVKPEASWVMFHCVDGYTAPIPVEDALHEDAIVAFKMNEKEIPLDQGYPARPFIPHLYGWKSAKWLNEIEFLPEYRDGYWEMFGYHERGDVWEEERFKGHKGKHTRRIGLGSRPI
jgi:DMSO/TMAO reductase YedYZ molybdopterin-dependent catalytic subunit